jgi:hypothetical protein
MNLATDLTWLGGGAQRGREEGIKEEYFRKWRE